MKTFNAEIKGVFVDDFLCKASVISVYSKALNILVPDGLLISIIRSKDELSALGILAPELFSAGIFIHNLLKPGTEVNITCGKVQVENIEINLNSAGLWEGLINFNSHRLEADSLALLEEALIKYGKRGGLLGVIDSSNGLNIFEKKAIDVLTGALERDGSSVLPGISGLVGLGVGFTPSGDDFISGVILGEELAELASEGLESAGFSETDDRGLLPVVDRRDIENTLSSTSCGGRTLLWQVLKNQFPFYMVKVAESLLTGDVSEILTSVSETVLHGETSGTDFLTGLLWYLKKCFLW